MIQKDFILKNPLSWGREISELIHTVKSTPHRQALLTIYETGFPGAQIKRLMDYIRSSLKDAEGERLKIAGISTYAMTDVPVTGMGIRLNLLLSRDTEFEVVTIPCVPGEEDNAISYMRERLEACPDIKAVQLFVCNMGLNIGRFIEETMRGKEEIGLFGTMSSRILPETLRSKTIGFDVFDVFNQAGMLRARNQYAISEGLIENGFVAVIYSGKELNVKLNYALGWHAIGRKMSFKTGEKGPIGETCLTDIGGMRPVDLYKEYLGVSPDKYFVSNICEFPLMVNRNGTDICLIPFDYGEKGEVFFNLALKEDEKLSFSYATHDEVLGAARDSCMDMADFNPDALFLILCGNRINMLREDASLEWEGFRQTSPDLALIQGSGELYYHYGKGGVLNSAHLAVGMREGEGKADTAQREMIDMKCFHKHKVIPLAERLSVFMTKMTGELSEMAEEAKTANLAKSAFLSSMSHEIRTPINAILGMDEMILRESNETDIIKYGENIRSAGNSLLGLINDILDFSKIEAGKMDIIPVEYEFASVVNDLYNVIKKRAEDKGLKVELKIDPSVPSVLYGDEIRIKQIITNILTNAVKYTEKGSVTFSVERLGERRDYPEGYVECHGQACFTNPVKLRISVKDTGIGIKDSDKERLFNAFERVDEKRNRTIEGTGLGLNITKRLLSLMDSSLSLESEYGKGSCFFFEIVQGISRDEPVGDINDRWNRQDSSHRKYRERFTAKNAKILVVDDTEMNLEVVKNLLKKTLIGIDTAESGEEALRLVKKNKYDMIFLDHRMPHMDGIECLKRMKEIKDNLSVGAPVISLTANAVSGAREEYLTAGFKDYLTKPIDSEKLEGMLIRYLPGEKVKLIGEEKPEDKKSEPPANYRGKPRIVLIDDEPIIHKLAEKILGNDYVIDTFLSGDDGLSAVKEDPSDLVLLDMNLPGKDGLQIIREIREDKRTAEIPVIFLTGDGSRDSETEGFKAGAWDYVKKPFAAEVLKQRVRHTIGLSHLQKELEAEVEDQILRVEHLTEEMMLSLSKTVDAKDHYTNGHSQRVAGYSAFLASRLGMDRAYQVKIHSLGLLHDIGKIGVREEIINKTGRLSDEEFDEVKKHTVMGFDILKTITELPELSEGARWHHERFDGKGYPDGKKGEEIPLVARIICVADAYDAMTSNRSYSEVRPQEKVRSELIKCRGLQFDPVIADKMLELIDEDTAYLMNEKHYGESRISSYVKELMEHYHSGFFSEGTGYRRRPGNDTGSVPDPGDTNGDMAFSSDDKENDLLPGWLKASDAVDADKGIINCGSVEGYLSVLASFHSSVREKADEIEGYYNRSDLENYTIKVHALKSSARIIGADVLSEKARLLEEAGDRGDMETIRRDTKELLSLYRTYEASLSDIAGAPDGNAGSLPEIGDDMLKDAYASLKEFAAAEDYELSRMVLDSLREYSLPEGDRKCFESIRSALSGLDFERIKEILKDRTKG